VVYRRHSTYIREKKEYIYIYIYIQREREGLIEREREREREREKTFYISREQILCQVLLRLNPKP